MEDSAQTTPRRPSVPDAPVPGRGGKRPGAGAPRGNLNGLKHGRHSKQLLALSRGIHYDPRMRRMFLAFVRATRRLQDGLREELDELNQDNRDRSDSETANCFSFSESNQTSAGNRDGA
jgi:hypothetical protein